MSVLHLIERLDFCFELALELIREAHTHWLTLTTGANEDCDSNLARF